MQLRNRTVVFFDKKSDPNYDPNASATGVQENLTLGGHYERVSLTEPFYYFVNANQPSQGNGVIVSDKELINLGINPKDPNGSLLKTVN